MKTKLFFSLTLSIFLLSLSSCGGFSIEKQLKKEIAEINKNLLAYSDDGVRLEGAEYIPSKTLKFNYTLLSYTRDELDLEVFKVALQKEILNVIKHDPQLVNSRKNDVNFIYSYKDRNGEDLIEIVITPEDYKHK